MYNVYTLMQKTILLLFYYVSEKLKYVTTQGFFVIQKILLFICIK